MCISKTHLFQVFSTFSQQETSIRIGYIWSWASLFRVFFFHYIRESTCSYSLLHYLCRLKSLSFSFYSFKLHGGVMCVMFGGLVMYSACGCGMRVWMQGKQMNERVTVIERYRVVIWLARGISMGYSLEDYHNEWTFENFYNRASLLVCRNFLLRKKDFAKPSFFAYRKWKQIFE